MNSATPRCMDAVTSSIHGPSIGTDLGLESIRQVARKIQRVDRGNERGGGSRILPAQCIRLIDVQHPARAIRLRRRTKRFTGSASSTSLASNAPCQGSRGGASSHSTRDDERRRQRRQQLLLSLAQIGADFEDAVARRRRALLCHRRESHQRPAARCPRPAPARRHRRAPATHQRNAAPGNARTAARSPAPW